jgi:hypothetical protein
MPLNRSQSMPPSSVATDAIRIVFERRRLCRFLYVVAGTWMIVGGLLYIAYVLFDVSSLKIPAFIIQLIGYALLSVAFAVTSAKYRCPNCDTRLVGLRRHETNCRNCQIQIRATE